MVRIIPILRSILLALFLVITIAACASRQPEIKKPVPAYYTVKTGDNLASIAFMQETTPEVLLQLNPQIQNQIIEPGMRLTTPLRNLNQSTRQSEQNNSAANFLWPLKKIDLSSRFGYRNGRRHSGIDLRAPRGTAVLASARGRVIFSGNQNGYGKLVIIRHSPSIQTAYAHNLKNLVNVGQIIKQGQTIARVGRSGNSTGYHVHFEFRIHGKAVNPIKHLRR